MAVAISNNRARNGRVGSASRGDDNTSFGRNVVRKRHQDWWENQNLWQRLLDSFEGGQRYRNATYGMDRGGMPERNLIRHPREYPDPQQFSTSVNPFAGYVNFGSGLDGVPGGYLGASPQPGTTAADPAATANDDDYELRRARTPVPGFMCEAIEVHLSKVYHREIARKGPAKIMSWWKNVDGRGTPMDDWMRETIAPLLMVLGCLDVCFDHPIVPEGVASAADEARLGLDRCITNYILPQNMVWWRKSLAGQYTECLVREYVDPSERDDLDEDGNPIDPNGKADSSVDWRARYLRWRYWTTDSWTLYNSNGSDAIRGPVRHGFPILPIVRLIDKVRHRSPNTGKSRYENTADLQREYYNRDSELILSDTVQAHPFLSGPEEFCKADSTVSVGPSYILPMKKMDNGGYQGWIFVSPPKDPAESLRVNKRDIRDQVDRENHLIKPAGTVGTAATTVSQSGVSKEMDAISGNRTLSSLSKSLARAERTMVEYAAMVIYGDIPSEEVRSEIGITYPIRFELQSAADLANGLTMFQGNVSACGQSPEIEFTTLAAEVRDLLPGQTDVTYKLFEEELKQVIAMKAQLAAQLNELTGATGATSRAEAMRSGGSTGGGDPSGQSGVTMVS